MMTTFHVKKVQVGCVHTDLLDVYCTKISWARGLLSQVLLVKEAAAQRIWVGWEAKERERERE